MSKKKLDKYQQGGATQLYGQAGDYLSNLLGGIESNPIFTPKTGTYQAPKFSEWMKSNNYPKPYAKQDFLGNTSWYVKDASGAEVSIKDLGETFKTNVSGESKDFADSQKAFNESLPLAKQLSALFDIQQKGNEEIENAKPILQDFQPLAASFAPRGFAQQGGVVDGQAQTKVMPSTDAIIGGLPKEMSEDDVDMVAKNAAKEQIRATREKLNDAYETLLEDAETKLKQKLALKGLDEETADSFIEDLYQNNFPVFDEELPESFSPIRKATIEDVKAKFGIFLPDLKDEVENIYNIEKGLKERFSALSAKEIELEMGVESKATDRKPKREGFKYFQQGGEPVSQLQQIMGYKDNSPYRNMATQNFSTNTLTMEGVSRPILAIANNGMSKVMQPNSGLHKFNGATNIMEIPIAKDGGRQMIFNLFKQRPVGNYENGGSTVSPSIQNNLPVGNAKKKIEGFIDIASLSPIQAEKGELIVLPTLDVTKVNAKKRHHQMPEDQVTDVVPENSYILSQFGKVDIYKSEADQAIVEVQNKPYNIYGTNPEPKTKSLGDYMSKKKMKPADLGRTLLNKYKQMNNPGDPFTEQTNAANKYTLSKYLEVLIGLSEMDKTRKGLNDDNSVAPQMFAKDGGRVLRTDYNVPKAQAGAIIGGASALISGIGSLFTNAKNRKLLQQNTAASLLDIGNLYKQQTGLENTALAANLVGFAAQNPEIKPVLENTNFLDATQRFIPQQQTDYLMGRALANRPDVTGMDPRLANGITGRYYAQALDNQSNFALQAAQARIGFLNNYLQQKQAAENRNAASRTNAFNATMANMNNLFAGSAGAISGSMTNEQNLLTNKLNATMAVRGQKTSGLIVLKNQLLQGLTNSAALGLQAYNDAQSAKQQQQIYDQWSYSRQFPNATPTLPQSGPTSLVPQNNPSDCILGRNIRTGLPC